MPLPNDTIFLFYEGSDDTLWTLANGENFNLGPNQLLENDQYLLSLIGGAGVPEFIPGDEGNVLRVNPTYDGYDSEAPTVSPTLDRVILRDASGRTQVADGVDPQDVVTKNQVDTFSGAVSTPTALWSAGYQIGNSFSTSASNFSGMAALTNETIALFIYGQNELRTYTFGGGGWYQAGNGLAFVGNGVVNMTALSPTRVAIVDAGTDTLTAYDWDGTDWAQVGTSFSLGDGGNKICALNSNTVAYHDHSTGRLYAYTFDGTNWSQLGNSKAIPGGAGTAVTALSATTIALLQGGATVGGESLYTYTFDGTNWAQVGNPLFIGEVHPAAGAEANANPVISALNPLDVLVTTIRDLRVYRWDGTDWYMVSRVYDFNQGYTVMFTSLNGTDIAFYDVLTSNLRRIKFEVVPGSLYSVSGGAF